MKLVLTFILLSCSTPLKKTTQAAILQNLSNPESVYFDPTTGLTFISNVDGEGNVKDGKGYISTLSFIDERLVTKEWLTGLNAPKGMRAQNGNLWVSDIDRVLVIDISTAKIIKEVQVPGAQFLNDIAITPDGTVYVSDTIGSSIYKIIDYKSIIFMKGDDLESPNGLLFQSGKLYVASWGLTTDWSTKVLGRLYSINIQEKKISYITKKPLGNLDGLEITGSGNFLVSDWVAGKIYKITQSGETELLLKTQKGSADIGFIPKKKLVIIPSMLQSKILTLKVSD